MNSGLKIGRFAKILPIFYFFHVNLFYYLKEYDIIFTIKYSGLPDGRLFISMGDAAPLLLAIVILLLLSGFFSSMETAYSCVNKLKLKTMIANGNIRAEKVLKLAEKYDSLISTILVGNNIVNITATSLAGIFFAMIIVNNTCSNSFYDRDNRCGFDFWRDHP